MFIISIIQSLSFFNNLFQMTYTVRIATGNDVHHAARIAQEYAISAQARGTGIAFRAKSYIKKKMIAGNAVITFVDDQLAGFCYIEIFENKKYVSNSGLIVFPEFRSLGLSKVIKNKIFELSQSKYPESKIFSITTSGVVMKMNTDLGYRPVPFTELTTDDVFWKNCQTCRNYDVLTRNDRKMCLCTGLLYDKHLNKNNTNKKENDEK